jgi:hypothetical protein
MADQSRVVDFQRFREARERARLPLFDDAPAPAGPLVAKAPVRTLTTGEVAHRGRMLRHLQGRA